ncbi:MAG TPA: type III pantothenate kinase [Cytophagaceae bacterium]|jgi:type III pantothenate kinase|nr:type III pantothenate kinase [Cytophagaceae bacterium]
MSNIVIDIGNTRMKVGVFENGVLVARYYDPTPTELKALQTSPDDKVIVSSVGHGQEEIKKLFEESLAVIEFNRSLNLPLSLRYDTPETLGLDRIAAAIGAVTLYPLNNVLVIDAGSCITIDLVNKEQEFCGGIISPGVKMRFKAMHTFTDKLPLVDWTIYSKENLSLPALSTQECMLAGVFKGMQFEIEGYVHHYSGRYPDLKVIMTGGDTQYFENIINTRIFTEESLVLIGLNRVLEYNVA